ncbi:hypothetical protein D3C81_1715760 [compost metagenome]
MLLAPSDKGRIGLLHQCLRLQPQAQIAGTFLQGPEIPPRRTNEHPGAGETVAVKMITGRKRREPLLWKIGTLHLYLHHTLTGIDHRPAVLPFHRYQERFPAQVAVVAAIRPGAQADHPPVAVLGFY